jgi:hypothetical protein
MAKIVKLNVMISASTKGLSAGITKAQGMLNKFERRTRSMRRDVGRAFGDMGRISTTAFKSLGVAAAGAAVGLAYLTKNSIDAIGDTNDFAKALGLTYNQLKAFQFAAGQAGVGSEQLNAAFAKMADTLGTAFGGDKGAIEKFEKIGLSIDKLKKMSPAQQFEAIANAINKIQDPSVKMAAARDIFGKSGGSLIALFENAGQAINQAAQTLEALGINLSQLDVSKVDNAGDALKELGLYAEGAGNQLAANFSPYISAAVESLKSWTAAAGGVGPAMDALIGGALDKMDSLLNKLSAAQKAYNDFASYVTAGVGYVADKAADFATDTGTSSSIRKEEENKRLEGIPAHRREQARALLEKQGGFEQEGITARRVANAMNSSSREYAKESDGITTDSGYGNQFRDWRAKAEYDANIAAGAVPIAPPVKYKDHVPNGYQAKQDEMKNATPDYKAKQDAMKSAIPDYKAKQEQMKNSTPGYKAKQDEMKNSEPILQVLRNIEANTGKNKIAFAGPN